MLRWRHVFVSSCFPAGTPLCPIEPLRWWIFTTTRSSPQKPIFGWVRWPVELRSRPKWIRCATGELCSVLCGCACVCVCALHVLFSPRLWDVCCTNCASSRCRLVKARWPSATAVSPSQTTPATPMICTALFVSSLYSTFVANLLCGLSFFFFFKPLCFFLFVPFFFFPPRIYVGAGSRQEARHLPGVLFCFQTGSADVPRSECEGQSLSTLTPTETRGSASFHAFPLWPTSWLKWQNVSTWTFSPHLVAVWCFENGNSLHFLCNVEFPYSSETSWASQSERSGGSKEEPDEAQARTTRFLWIAHRCPAALSSSCGVCHHSHKEPKCFFVW